MNTHPKQKQKEGKTLQEILPTAPGEHIKNARAKQIATLFIQYAEKYHGDIVLPRELVSKITRDLKKIKVNGAELVALDERPYACLSHDIASQSHWFMRRFRNSDGWQEIVGY